MRELDRRDFLTRLAYLGAAGAGLSVVGLLTQGCSKDISGMLGQISTHSDSIFKVWESGSKALEDITPEQEYYIGRTVGAIVLSKYPPYTKSRANNYINLIGQTLAQFSDLPYLFDAYHFLILDSNDINAFATSSGLVFVTRGMIHCCRTEDTLAAVLAHEIAHIQHRHGLEAIKQSRITDALSTVAIEGTKVFGSEELACLTDTFEESIDDIVTTMVTSGYSMSSEYEAEASAVTILRRTGFHPAALIELLKTMDKRLKPGGVDFAATHPSPKSRIKELAGVSVAGYKPNSERERRFKVGVRGV